MKKMYVDPINGRWQDDVGRKKNRLINDVADMMNDVAEDMDESFRRIEDSKRRELEFKPRTPELLELQARLRNELGI